MATFLRPRSSVLNLGVLGFLADIGSPVHAQHVRAHIRKQHAAKRTRPDAGEFHDPDPVERAHGVIVPFRLYGGASIAREEGPAT